MSGRPRGFSLIELMVVVAIIGIIAALALPSYSEQVRQTRRTEGKRKLHEVALAQARFYTNCNRYALDLAGSQNDCSGLGMVTPVQSEEGHYLIDLQPQAGGWLVRATPQGDQLSDLRCTSLMLGSTGQQTATGSDPDNC